MSTDLRTAVLLCAGRATRLWPVTLARPKALIEVANKPIVARILEKLAAAGFERAIIVIPAGDSALPNYLAANPVEGIELSFVAQEHPRGLADATACAAEAVGDEPFMLHLGDELIEGGVEELVRQATKPGAIATVLLKAVEDPRHFGVAVIEEGRIVEFIEKPAEPPSPYAIVGLYAFTPLIFEAIAATKPSKETGEVEITDALQWLIEEGHVVRPAVFEGQWFDVGRFETLLAANRYYLTAEITEPPPPLGEHCSTIGYAKVSRNCTMVDSVIKGPCIIAAGCELQNATIGPNVAIAEACTIRNSTVSNCIIGRGCTVVDVPGGLVNSVLGMDVHVTGGGTEMPMQVFAADRTVVGLGVTEEE
ncbi:MAG: NTP transferase domain-containing protein [Armatimonadetes bacterium]|nr:NTP transferase domain-containing protein [Armatimonadota bacterium]